MTSDEDNSHCLVPKNKKFKPPPMTWDEVMNYITNEEDVHFPNIPEVDTIEIEGDFL